jgi:hypothetical protein
MLISFLAFPYLMFSNTSVVCGKYLEIDSIKGRKILVYSFKKNGKIHEGNVQLNRLKAKDILSFKNGKCIEIEVSNYWSFFNKIQEN